MCYSAQITAAYQKLVRMTGATLSLQEFAALHVVHPEKNCPETPMAMEGAFRVGRKCGITIGGVQVGTMLDDRNRLSGVLSAIQLGGLESVDFKAANGWVQLSTIELQGIAQAVSLHVQACFSVGRAHHEAIDRLDSPVLIAAYDVTQGGAG